jgi:hypothetical protein
VSSLIWRMDRQGFVRRLSWPLPCSFPQFAWTDWGNPRRNVRIIGNPPEVQAGDVPSIRWSRFQNVDAEQTFSVRLSLSRWVTWLWFLQQLQPWSSVLHCLKMEKEMTTTVHSITYLSSARPCPGMLCAADSVAIRILFPVPSRERRRNCHYITNACQPLLNSGDIPCHAKPSFILLWFKCSL